jgi:hypothetical protein
MKKENAIDIEQLNQYIKSNKDSFRQHQRDLSFDQKMRIAFSLAERDRTIRRAVPLPKNGKIKRGWE